MEFGLWLLRYIGIICLLILGFWAPSLPKDSAHLTTRIKKVRQHYLFVETILFKFWNIGQQTMVRSIPCNDKLDLRSRYKANVNLRLHNIFPNRSRNLRVKNQHGAD